MGVLVIIVIAGGIWYAVQRHTQTPSPAAAGPAYAEDPAPSWPAARALGWVEGRRLVTHPAFVFGMVITPLMLWAARSSEAERELWHVQFGMVLALAPLGWMAIVAADLSTLRARRHGTAELLDSLPATPASRTAGHLLSSLATVPVTLAFLLGWLALEVWVFDSIGAASAVELLIAVPLVVGGAVVGVAVGRWLPMAVFGFGAVAAVIALQGVFTTSDHRPFQHLAFLPEPTAVGDPLLQFRRPAWHIGYLVGLTVLLAAVALARHGLSRAAVTGLVTGALVVAGTGWAQTRPPSAQRVAEMVAFLEHPADHQDCELHGGVRYCAYSHYTPRVADWRVPVEAVLARVPAAVRPGPLVVRQRAETVIGDSNCQPATYASELASSVRGRIDPARVWPADGDVHPGFNWPDQFACGGRDAHGLFLAVQTGAWAVGLPPAPSSGDRRCAADGQSRAALALWLGAQSSPGAASALAALTRDEGAWENDRLAFPSRGGSGWDSPPMWGVTWHRTDVDAALALLRRPADDVARTIAAGWDHLRDPATPTSALLGAAGAGGGATTSPAALLLGSARTCA